MLTLTEVQCGESFLKVTVSVKVIKFFSKKKIQMHSLAFKSLIKLLQICICTKAYKSVSNWGQSREMQRYC